MWRTPIGPVLERRDGKAYVLKSPGWGEYRKAEQFLRMMRARSLEEWRAAVAMRAHTESNLTYADRAGNILYFWNAALPRRPHPSGGDTAAVPARTTDEVWTTLYPPEALPQLLNPRTGELQIASRDGVKNPLTGEVLVEPGQPARLSARYVFDLIVRCAHASQRWMCTSVPQIPVLATRILTSLIPTPGSGTSSSQRPGSARLFTSAFTGRQS